eukprot:303722_1
MATKNVSELKQHIEIQFSTEYTKQKCNELSLCLLQYFEEQQFDEWNDILDDISGGYKDCCCKQIINKVLNITDVTKQNIEYNRLKDCIITTTNTSSQTIIKPVE